MAWRLGKSIVKGEIDNRIKGRISGRLWLLGRDEAVELSLTGNCLRDVAGCKLSFDNPHPQMGENVHLHGMQGGVAGEMTASRKIRVLDVSLKQANEMRLAGKAVPEHRGNCLHLEWFSRRDGRVVIEASHFRLIISEPYWSMSKHEEGRQVDANHRALESWLGRHNLKPARLPDQDRGESMDEFAWERHLREADARADRFSRLLEQYMDEPDRDRIIAREMGWIWLEEAMDQESRSHGRLVDPMNPADLPEAQPNPLTEGVDWILNAEGRVVHPLVDLTHALSMGLWHYCQDHGLLGQDGDADLHDMLFETQTLGIKLAGALNGLAYDGVMEAGFVVACLKRALVYFDGAVAAAAKVRAKGTLDPKRLADFRQALFLVREQVLRLMDRFRG